NAAARPAAAPVAAPTRRFCLGSPTIPASNDPAAPASCTLGPSRPRLAPPPICTAPARNFTQSTRNRTEPKTFQKAALSGGMPLPAASVQNEFSNQPDNRDVPRTSTRLLHRKVDSGYWDRRRSPV